MLAILNEFCRRGIREWEESLAGKVLTLDCSILARMLGPLTAVLIA